MHCSVQPQIRCAKVAKKNSKLQGEGIWIFSTAENQSTGMKLWVNIQTSVLEILRNSV